MNFLILEDHPVSDEPYRPDGDPDGCEDERAPYPYADDYGYEQGCFAEAVPYHLI